MIIKHLLYVLLPILFIFNGASLHAEDDNSLYSEVGVIDDIRLNENVIIVDDQLFEIVPYAKVHGHRKYPNVFVIQNLKKGMIVGIKLESINRKINVVTELWLLESLPPDNNEG